MWTKSTLSVHKLYSKCPPLARTHARYLPRHWSIVSSNIDCSRLHQTSTSCHFNSSTLWICLVDAMLHDSPDLIIHRTEIWALWRPQVGCKKVWHFWRSSSTFACAPRRRAVCWCLLSCWNKVINSRHSAYRWQQYDVIMTWSSVEEVSKRYYQTACFVTTMKLPHALQIYSTVFVKKCMLLHFSR